ncbi:MAG TPA: 30S ribosomal protein S20 [Candidatus Borkfalkia excrementigallinarum]|uniref:Small ribosomal subunit protein bS20 n=1 Tax=Candidatus Borkfalkia excrementigallinarum TaxID=2838506 RepID=A0A9D1ZY65_9FIRM|nr:30S ribosomal protein S20 [Candidatus Borkfalkia excrementigallinarum]
MPNIKSAKKRVLVTEKKNSQNKMIKSAVKTAIKKYNAALAAGDVAEAEKLLPETVSIIDSAASKGIIHKNNAANKKSALAKNLNALKAAPAKAEEPKAEEVKEEAKAAPVAEAAAPAAEEKPKKTRAKKAKAEDAE